MKDRLKKKIEANKRGVIHQILDSVLDINGLSPRAQKLTGNKPTAFFDFNGHVGIVDTTIYKDGWAPGCGKDYEGWLQADNREELATAAAELRAIYNAEKSKAPAVPAAGGK